MRLVVKAFSISIDGFGAGPDQSLDNPLGVGGPELFDWFFHTRTWNQMHGNPDGETGIDDDLAARAFDNIGAWILGRNMFGPVRGVTGGIEAALEQAKAAAKGKDVRVGAGRLDDSPVSPRVRLRMRRAHRRRTGRGTCNSAETLITMSGHRSSPQGNAQPRT